MIRAAFRLNSYAKRQHAAASANTRARTFREAAAELWADGALPLAASGATGSSRRTHGVAGATTVEPRNVGCLSVA
jgi:hypothetical protein